MSGLPSPQERLYRALLRVYPTPFRVRFGDEMVQLMGDQFRDAMAGRSSGGVGRLWLRTLGDLVVTATSEHLRRDRTVAHSLTVSASPAMRALGILGILGGLVLVAAFLPLPAWSSEIFNLRLVLFNAGAIAIGLAAYRGGALGSRRISMAVAGGLILANAWHVVMVLVGIGRPQFPEPDVDFRLIFFYAALAMWLADALFGFVIWRVAAMARWIGLILAIGSLFALTGMDRFELVRGDLAWFWRPAALAGAGANGLAWIALGLVVATRRRSIAVPSTAPEST